MSYKDRSNPSFRELERQSSLEKRQELKDAGLVSSAQILMKPGEVTKMYQGSLMRKN